MKDPIYRKILKGLEEPLDPRLFEEAVCDLLRGSFPSLVPISGGQDRGMDGAIAEGPGEAYPLVCTTARDVPRNLRNSLQSYKDQGGQRRRAVLATSRALTPTKRSRLEAAARDLSFTLVQVIDREGIAQRLYHCPRWRVELLGIPGESPTLAPIPRSRRLLLDLDLVGREKDLAWLLESTGDRLVVGQPGSGKTALLFRWARETDALFVVRDDAAGLADELRKCAPKAVIVDDAHVRLEILSTLRNLRQNAGFKYDLVATTWPSLEDELLVELGELPSSQVRRLELLTRREIRQVLEAAGVEAHADVMRELIDQSSNRPGLAVTLAELWKRGAWRDVLLGAAISRSLRVTVKDVVGPESFELLAWFGLGGETGLTLDEAARGVGKPAADVRRIVVELASGGILKEASRGYRHQAAPNADQSEPDTGTLDRGRSTLAVLPEAFRRTLVRDVFFSGTATDLDPWPWLESLKGALLSDATEEIAKAVGPLRRTPREDQIQNLIKRGGPLGAWRWWAISSEDRARWALANFRGELAELAPVLLARVPREAAKALLYQAAKPKNDDAWRLDEEPELRALSRWTGELGVSVGQLLERRSILVEAARKFVADGDDPELGLRATLLAFSPRINGQTRDPAVGNTFTINWCYLPPDAYPTLLELWRTVDFSRISWSRKLWGDFSSLLWEHCQAQSFVQHGEDEERHRYEFITTVLRDLARSANDHPALAAALVDHARRLKVDIKIPIDGVFDLLYPSPHERITRPSDDFSGPLDKLASEWLQLGARSVAEKLRDYQRDIHVFGGGNPPHNLEAVAERIAGSLFSLEPWLRELLDFSVSGEFLAPFLRRALEAPEQESQPSLLRAAKCEESLSIQWNLFFLVLSRPNVSQQLLEAVLERLPSFPALVELVCLRRQAPVPVLKTLLEHRHPLVSLSAVVGLSHRGAPGVPDEIESSIRDAMLRVPIDFDSAFSNSNIEYWLGSVLAENPDLAFAWIKRRLEDSPELRLRWSPLGPRALTSLSQEQRSELLHMLPKYDCPGEAYVDLVARSPELFRVLLCLPGNSPPREVRLSPLGGGAPKNDWRELALRAVESGASAEEIARASFRFDDGIAGDGPESWAQWRSAFESLSHDPDRRIKDIAGKGLEEVEQREERGLSLQREIELAGFR